jgi:hypothetical protein
MKVGNLISNGLNFKGNLNDLKSLYNCQGKKEQPELHGCDKCLARGKDVLLYEEKETKKSHKVFLQKGDVIILEKRLIKNAINSYTSTVVNPDDKISKPIAAKILSWVGDTDTKGANYAKISYYTDSYDRGFEGYIVINGKNSDYDFGGKIYTLEDYIEVQTTKMDAANRLFDKFK